MKYYLSLCAIIKDEKYLEEFLLYYIINGVEHFYLYDNESKFPLKERLINQIFKKKCTIINYPGKCRQFDAYNDCINKTKNISKWLIIIDGDEFIFTRDNVKLRRFLNYYDDNGCHALGINWLMFGSNYHKKKQKGLLIDNYVRCDVDENKCCKVNQHIKTICKPIYVKNVHNPHFVDLYDPSKYLDPDRNIISGPFNHNGNFNKIQINHYWGKSLSEYKKKVKRGNPDTLNEKKLVKNYMDLYNGIKDKSLKNRYTFDIKKQIEKYNLDILN